MLFIVISPSLGSNLGAYIAFSCHVSLASWNLEQLVHLPLCFLFLAIVESGFPGGSVERIQLSVQETQETWVQCLSQEDPLE